MTRPKQQELAFKAEWGGARKGAGRKKLPRELRKGIRHERRKEFARNHPLHVTVRMAEGVTHLRTRKAFEAIGRALERAKAHGLRLTHYSVQGNHLHLIAEAEHRHMLSVAMRSFGAAVARQLNGLMRRKGRVVGDRYHYEVLRTPTQVRRAIRYVLSNSRKHAERAGRPLPAVTRDDYAAGPADHVPPEMLLRPSALLSEPRTWLLRVGWSRGKVAATHAT